MLRRKTHCRADSGSNMARKTASRAKTPTMLQRKTHCRADSGGNTASTYNTSFRYGPVTECGSSASSSGVPWATM